MVLAAAAWPSGVARAESEPIPVGPPIGESRFLTATVPADSGPADPAGADAVAGADAATSVVINEILYKPANNNEWLEFIEFYNPAASAVDMTGWTLRGGVDFDFPSGSRIPGQGYIVVGESPQALASRFGITALGPFKGNLSSQGESLELRDYKAELVDEMAYGRGFPWPNTESVAGSSIQLTNPAFDNALPGHWRSGQPTPGKANAVLLGNAPPRYLALYNDPQQPHAGDAVRIVAQVRDDDGIKSVRLGFQVVAPGAYIAIDDPAYQANWTWIPMTATGSDLVNGIYSTILPGSIQVNRTLVRYRIETVDNKGQVVVAPYADDPQPNFAYFVYNGLPTWYASIQGSRNATNFDFNAMKLANTYFFLASQADVADAMFMPPSRLGEGYMDDEYRWHGTLVSNGVVYDHVDFRARGGLTRYATGKTNWKIAFLPGHDFQAYDNFGKPYPELVDNLNLNASIQQTLGLRDRRGEQGMYESTTYKLFNLAGVPAPNTHFVNWRVIDSADEYGESQYDGDFWGLYLAVEQMDGHFIDQHELPDGNLYKMDWEAAGGDDRNHLGRNGPADYSDLNAFLNAYQFSDQSVDWWRQHFDLDNYYSFRAILELVHDYDVDQGKNYFYFNNPDTQKWEVFPWDVDLTWHLTMPGTGVEPFLHPVLGKGDFQIPYQNRLREIIDLLFNPDQMLPLLGELSGKIDSPADGNSLVDADRYKWDFNPIFGTRYVNRARTEAGHYYIESPDGTFEGMIELMRLWVFDRATWANDYLLTDHGYPRTPSIAYAGTPGFPADSLRFSTGAFSDPQGDASFGAMEWRIAEVTSQGAVNYDPTAPFLFEINAAWESGELQAYNPQMTPPPGVVLPGHAYRVRVRMEDNTGRWSHWSDPVEFIAGYAAADVNWNLKISEIMYHPLAYENMPAEDLEYIELYNAGTQPYPLSGMRIVNGIEYAFPNGATLDAGEYMVLASDAESFKRRYDAAPFGEYDKHLSNKEDVVTLLDPWGRTVSNTEYSDSAPWPAGVDGTGYAMVYDWTRGGSNNPKAWSRGNVLGGSPGSDDPQVVLINEVLTQPADARAIELYNAGNRTANVSYWYLSENAADPRKVAIPNGTTIPAGGFVVLDGSLLTQSGPDGGIDWSAGQGALVLSSANVRGRLTGYQTAIRYGATESGTSSGRFVDSLGREHFPPLTAVTLGQANAAPRFGPIVVSAVQYYPTSGSEYIELTNISGDTVKLYDPARPTQTWSLQGGFYMFPAGVEIPPGGRILVVPGDPAEACASYGARGFTRIVGPFDSALNNLGQAVSLVRPVETPAGVSTTIVDSVTYLPASPWPPAAAGLGAAMRRANVSGFGSDPANWTSDSGLPGVDAAATTAPTLCSFTAHRDDSESSMVVTWRLVDDSSVKSYNLWRGPDMDFDHAIPVEIGSAANADGSSPDVVVVHDSDGDPDSLQVYWLAAVTSDGSVVSLGATSTQMEFRHAFLPILKQ